MALAEVDSEWQVCLVVVILPSFIYLHHVYHVCHLHIHQSVSSSSFNMYLLHNYCQVYSFVLNFVA